MHKSMFFKIGKCCATISVALLGLIGVNALATNANASAIHNNPAHLSRSVRIVKSTVPKLNNSFSQSETNQNNNSQNNNSTSRVMFWDSKPLYKTVYGNDSSDADKIDKDTVLVDNNNNNSVNITCGWSSNNNHYIMASHPTWVHSGLIFSNRNHISTLKAGTPEVVRNTFNAFYQNGGRNNHYRFEIAPQRFVAPMNVEHLYINHLSNLNKGSRKVQLRQSVIEYHDSNATKRVRRLATGKILSVRRIIRIGKYDMTRLQLTNNNFITANKDYVAIL